MVVGAGRWLDRVNARHPWNHNEHFHGWILRNLPARRRAAVDVGCGTGVLAGKLASSFARVTGIDADAGMAVTASARVAQDPAVTIRRCRFEDFAAAAGDERTAGPGQSMTAPPVKLISVAVIVRAQSDAAKTAMLATSS